MKYNLCNKYNEHTWAHGSSMFHAVCTNRIKLVYMECVKRNRVGE